MNFSRTEKEIRAGENVAVGIVVAHYHSATDLCYFLRSLFRAPMPEGTTRRVVVVNNGGSLPPDVNRSGVRIIQPKTNLGFLNGCCYGVERFVAKEGEHPQWWIVANADLRIDPSFFYRLLRHRWPSSIGWLCPDIRESDAWPRNPFHAERPTTRWMRNRVRLFSSSWLTVPYVTAARWKRTMSTPPAVPPSPTSIYAGHGSLALLHRRFFQKGGTLSYEGFLYGEEIHLAEQMRCLGLQVWWSPSLHAIHRGGSVIDGIPISQRRVWWEESYRYLCETYF